MILMRQYQIYMINDAIVQQYFGKESLLFTLFNDYYHSKGDRSRILSKQIQFITMKIPSNEVNSLFLQSSPDNQIKHEAAGEYYISKQSSNGNIHSSARITIKPRVIHLLAEGHYDAEAIFFEEMRKCKGSFLAVDLQNTRYGWLRPIKERKLI